MPVMRCTNGGKPGWKCGDSGRCYPYTSGDAASEKRAKKRAIDQCIAAGEDPSANAVGAENFTRLIERGRADAERELATAERIYANLLAFAGRQAAAALRASALIGGANWQPPPEGILVPVSALAVLAAGRLRALHVRVLRAVASSTLARIGIAWDVTHPLSAELLEQAGKRTGEALGEAVQPIVREIVADAYQEGLSVVQAAELIRAKVDDVSPWQAQMLARTDLNGLANGGSVMAAKLAGVERKRWLTAHDERVRPTHAAADGQTVPVGQPFSVGGEHLQHPGDPSGSNAEVANCRCTVTYPGPEQSAPPARVSSGGAMEELATAVAAPVRWQAVLAVEGAPTEDGRMLAPGSITWRELPMTLMALTETGPGGHEGAQLAGRIDEIWRDADKIMGSGIFDSGEFGTEVERLVREQTLRGVSVDLAVREFEVRIVGEDGEVGDEIDSPLDLTPDTEALFVVTDGVIGAATVCPFQAIGDASITILGSGNEAWRLERDGEFSFPGPTIDDRLATAVDALTAVTEMRARLDAAQAHAAEKDELVETLTARHARETEAQKEEKLALIDSLTAQIAAGKEISATMVAAIAQLTERKPRSLTVIRDDDGRAVGYEEVTA
jgi:hypothetical protein